MLPSLLLGLLALGAVVYFLQWYGNAKTADVKKSLRWVGIGLGLLLFAVLALTGRLGIALAFLTGLMAWAVRVFSLVQMGRQFSGMFKGLGGQRPRAGSQSSRVGAAFLDMSLDHDTGHLEGTVAKGTFAGRALGSMSFEELMGLLGEVRTDPDSLALLESYLDRAHPDWRARVHDGPKAGQATPGAAMSRDEALQILGLQPGAQPDAIKAAYRRLMAQVHPDRGGTDYLAAKINAAKDLLLKD